jgi:hypothetical protein
MVRVATSPTFLARRRSERPAAARPRGRRWHWLLAIVPGFVVRGALASQLLNMEQLLGLAVACGVLAWFARYPDRALRALVVVLPFQLLVTAALYAMGVGGPTVRMLGLWKEVAAAGIIVAAWQAATKAGRQIDALDRLCIGYVGLGTVFLVAQPVLVSGFGGDVSLDDRFVSWRSTVLPVLLLLAARHLRISREQARRLVRTLVGLGGALGAVAVFELVASDTWNHFVVDTLGVNRFRLDVLDVPFAALAGRFDDIRVYGSVGSRQIVRMGGPMIGQLEFSFLLLVVFAVVVEHLVRADRSRRAPAIGLLVAFALVLTQTRSSILGAVVVVALVVRPRAGRMESSQHRLAILATTLLLVALPFVLAGGLADRFTVGDTSSNQDHSQSLRRGLDAVGHDPLGRGLGMGALAGGSYTPGAIVPENQLLDIGVQLGVVGMALFAAVLAALVVRLGRVDDGRAPGTPGVLGARTALLGLLVPCWFLQPLVTPEVGWLLLAVAGAVLGAAERERAEAQRDPYAVERLLD